MCLADAHARFVNFLPNSPAQATWSSPPSEGWHYSEFEMELLPCVRFLPQQSLDRADDSRKFIFKPIAVSISTFRRNDLHFDRHLIAKPADKRKIGGTRGTEDCSTLSHILLQYQHTFSTCLTSECHGPISLYATCQTCQWIRMSRNDGARPVRFATPISTFSIPRMNGRWLVEATLFFRLRFSF